jgi:hypothetical protein
MDAPSGSLMDRRVLAAVSNEPHGRAGRRAARLSATRREVLRSSPARAPEHAPLASGEPGGAGSACAALVEWHEPNGSRFLPWRRGERPDRRSWTGPLLALPRAVGYGWCMVNTEREQLFHEAIMGAARPLAKLVALELAELVREGREPDPPALAREAQARVQRVLGEVLAHLRATVREFVEQGLSPENIARLIGQHGGQHIPQA